MPEPERVDQIELSHQWGRSTYMSAEVENEESEYTDLFIEMAVDPAAPWERYQVLIEKGVVNTGGGKVLMASRAAVEAA
jgi:hypothetical protein